jgi:DDE superfamily endonuclease
MLTYEMLKTKPKEFLSATGQTVEEFERLLPAFSQEYQARYEADQTVAGLPRQRKVGGGAKGKLQRMEDKLLFTLVYQKTYPLQTMQGLHFEMSQSQANEWIHRLLPVLQGALAALGMKPERDAQALADNEQVAAEPADFLMDGSERRRQRPKDKEQQVEQYSGKKKAHTDKNVLIVNGQTDRVVYLSQTEPGRTHDKKVADNEGITYPTGTTLSKDTGFQGYEPAGVATSQPKKSREALN